MSDQQRFLMSRANEKYGTIRPCGGKDSFSECFTMDRGRMVFWFNTRDNTTHIEVEQQARPVGVR